MRILFLILSLGFSAPVFGAGEKCEPVYKCECTQAVPFEAWVMYMVEKCGDNEQWYLFEPRPRQYSDQAACDVAIKAEVECP